ncbi:unnamed protein product [Colletotrichum noveboracense]|uniref:Uncharacterized protein n=1 Tax=Colletotrichum noveboracense TaxID=2664923 RepID=A0A9W4RUB5_9PEZI|nr:hypothetical protein COL940_003622 [Colletotrichum noveboracense]KAJ0302717.1 hypothetical protein Brms1b_011934 [Colletotrichum noveboracense]CAI0647799.1 unnamed protein product [Colletotrichum noveboracense]
MGDANPLKPVEALVLPSPSSNQRLSGPANKAAVNAEPFTYDNAVALHCQIEVFQRSYQKEGYRVPDNASSREIELAMIRGTLNLRIHEIRLALFHNFVAFPTPTASFPAFHPTTILFRDYQDTLTSATEAWAKFERERRRASTSQEEWWEAARQEQEDVDYDADADDGGSSGVSQPLRRKKNEMKERATLYRAVKQEMRRRGDLLTKNEESDNAVARRRSNFSLPEHVKTKDDLLIYLNQLGLRYTPRTATQRRRSRLRMLMAP